MGAPQARLSDLAYRFHSMEHRVEVLTAFPNYPTGKIFEGYPTFISHEHKDGLTVWRSWIIPSNRPSLPHRLMSYMSFCFSSLIVGSTRIGRPDVIFTESPPIFLAAVGWLLSKLKRAKWIMNVSDLWPDSAKYVGMLEESGLAYRSLKYLACFLYGQAHLVTGQSVEIVTAIKEQVPSAQVYHLSNGVDTQRFAPVRREASIRCKYLRKGEIGFLYAGLHGLFQGLDQIIQVASLLRNYPCRFILIGDGPDKKALMASAENLQLDNVDFYPPVPHNQMPEILASMDIAVITLKSHIRGAVPSKIYEAMSSGIPILLVAEGEAREIVKRTKAGIVVSPGNADALIAAIHELIDHPETREQMGAAGRIAAKECYDRMAIAKKFETVVEEMRKH
jgi:glycosyltransferase involved in cell wall biosynthesis